MCQITRDASLRTATNVLSLLTLPFCQPWHISSFPNIFLFFWVNQRHQHVQGIFGKMWSTYRLSKPVSSMSICNYIFLKWLNMLGVHVCQLGKCIQNGPKDHEKNFELFSNKFVENAKSGL